MKVSLHWLRRFVDFDLTATELAEKLTMRGFESEVVSDFDSLENLVVGDVLTAEKHPDADKLKLCSVSDGSDTFSVVCGASNVRLGMKSVFANIGTFIPGLKLKLKRVYLRSQLKKLFHQLLIKD